jgi:23S rRNA (cytosine1962-C5)-methyltransferase
MPVNRIPIKVSKEAERAIRRGHPWVFENSISKISDTAKTGDIAIIFDQKRNQFLALGLIDLESPIRIKMVHYGKPKIIDLEFWKEKLHRSLDIRAPLLKTDTNAFRLIHGENDGMPSLIVDVYNQVVVVKIYSGLWIPYLADIYNLMNDLMQPAAIIQRLGRVVYQNYDLEDGAIVKGTLENEKVQYREHGVLFSTNVIHGHKTGSFLDHRHNRLRVSQLSKDKSVLDVFSYAGGFSVHAAVGGALEVTSLDISQQALNAAVENMALNTYSTNHQILRMDAFKGLEEFIKKRKMFDLVIVDPPSFAKKESEIEGAINSYTRLARLASRLVTKNGIIVLASCSSRVNDDSFFEACEKGLNSRFSHFSLFEKTFHDIDHPISFPEGAYLKCGYWATIDRR